MSDTPLRIVFAGTPEFAAESLAAVLETEHQVVAVYTQPDRPAGRGRKLRPSPVKALALEHDLPVYQPLSLKDAEQQQILADLNADLMIVVAYGLLLPQAVLDTPRLGCINVHASLLPRWRGAAPIHRALLAGDITTGITIMQMDAGLDTGDMLSKAECTIENSDTSGTLHDRLAVLGAQLLVETLAPLAAGTLSPEPQDGSLATYAHKLEKQEGQIDWSLPAEEVVRRVRGFNPWPVCFTQLGDDNLRVWSAELDEDSVSYEAGTILAADGKGVRVACGEGSVRLTQLQLPGGKAQPVKNLLNAHKERFAPGVRLG
ncbi:methionyl-tRNA formyltransferase [Marinobacterium sediminicola]|uniref:Methionyl-tRNA formyltransferase n=1 Tax=Marinobacterium sediminicola TaxID=518898 RepID=A0ABY1S2Y0_9GAMM|nr:methionyl-tRNA formyltransferase [Marinobacterium sediminicola]ULG69248.1 methionyl-tRNA formyltransferase [Marinobacterium sediminicola]SMR77596.1 methionyl-tRNA formyltransferase [Marinobacterium sediminicola]